MLRIFPSYLNSSAIPVSYDNSVIRPQHGVPIEPVLPVPDSTVRKRIADPLGKKSGGTMRLLLDSQWSNYADKGPIGTSSTKHTGNLFSNGNLEASENLRTGRNIHAYATGHYNLVSYLATSMRTSQLSANHSFPDYRLFSGTSPTAILQRLLKASSKA